MQRGRQGVSLWGKGRGWGGRGDGLFGMMEDGTGHELGTQSSDGGGAACCMAIMHAWGSIMTSSACLPLTIKKLQQQQPRMPHHAPRMSHSAHRGDPPNSTYSGAWSNAPSTSSQFAPCVAARGPKLWYLRPGRSCEAWKRRAPLLVRTATQPINPKP